MKSEDLNFNSDNNVLFRLLAIGGCSIGFIGMTGVSVDLCLQHRLSPLVLVASLIVLVLCVGVFRWQNLLAKKLQKTISEKAKELLSAHSYIPTIILRKELDDFLGFNLNVNYFYYVMDCLVKSGEIKTFYQPYVIGDFNLEQPCYMLLKNK